MINRAVPRELDGPSTITSSVSGKSGARSGSATGDRDAKRRRGRNCILNQRLLECLATDDAREGLMAFLEKRAPRWTDK